MVKVLVEFFTHIFVLFNVWLKYSHDYAAWSCCDFLNFGILSPNHFLYIQLGCPSFSGVSWSWGWWHWADAPTCACPVMLTTPPSVPAFSADVLICACPVMLAMPPGTIASEARQVLGVETGGGSIWGEAAWQMLLQNCATWTPTTLDVLQYVPHFPWA